MTVAPQLMSSARTGTGRDDWRTPKHVLDLVQMVAPIWLDPCASLDRGHCFVPCNFTVGGLTLDWCHGRDRLVYVNPPYSQLREWMAKCEEEARKGTQIIALVPARTDTRAWHESVFFADAICFWSGRIKFEGAGAGAPFPSALVYWGDNVERFACAFADVGRVVLL